MRGLRGLLALSVLAGCKPEDDELAADDPRVDPATCEECHPDHHREWLGSMHAYAAEDPVFRAMNERGQRETGGALGDFCVNCHAPMAVRFGLTTDGLNLDDIEPKFRGVTCVFCHTVTAVEGTHNNPLVLSGEGTMFGPVRDPVDNDVHDSEYSPFLDSRTFESSDMCGSCHDIVTDANVHIERTFTQWQDSFFSDADDLSGGPANYSLGCANCHGGLPEPGTIADYPGVKGDRTRHPHHMQAVDLALHPWPSAELGPQLQQTQRDEMERQRRGALCASICVTADAEGADVDVYLHNEFAAHAWPSGASQDRRAWLEVEAFAGDDALLSIGRVEDGEPVADIASPDLWQLRDYLYDEAGNEVHMFWEARSVDGETLPGAEILSPMGDASTWRVRRYRVDDPALDRVTTRVRLRPVGLDVLDSLIDSGDLDPALRAQMQTFDYPSTVLEWTPDNLDECDPDDARCPTYGECVSSNGIGCGAPLIGAPKPGQ